MPFQRANKHYSISNSRGKVNGLGNQGDVSHVKRTPSSPQGGPKKRSAFVDLTNTSRTQQGAQVKSGKPGQKALTSKVVKTKSKCPSSEVHSKKAQGLVEESLSEDISPSPPNDKLTVQHVLESAIQEQKIPEEFDIDKEQAGDCLMTPEYAKDIFDYLKNREEKFVLTDYMHIQSDLNGDMRGILVDWMVEVQENFELCHETLYLAVKLTDHYLSVIVALRESLQLIGSTAMLIAAKFEERCPPSIDDFLYICDDAYKRQEFIVMERNILQGLNFDINIPIPYRFLRRYAKMNPLDLTSVSSALTILKAHMKCHLEMKLLHLDKYSDPYTNGQFTHCIKWVAHASMETLTLARYICEFSLLELELVLERASHLASACLLLALITKGLGGWTAALQYHSGYALSDLSNLVRRLYAMLVSPSDEKLKAVENKYSHKVFFEVAKIPLVHIETLEEALSKQDIS